MALTIMDLKRSIIERDIEISRLRKIETAARDLATYDDFGEPDLCPHCSPDAPNEYNAARLRLHAALST